MSPVRRNTEQRMDKTMGKNRTVLARRSSYKKIALEDIGLQV